MSEDLGTIYVKIQADTKRLDKEVQRLKGKLDKDATKMGASFSAKMKTALFAGGGILGAILAVRKAFDFSRETKNLARDALETKTKFEQVFSSIKDKANSTAKALAKGFGIANTTARELIGNTGDLLVGFGFTEKKSLELSDSMVRLASDLSSFKNISGGVQEALNLMVAAMSGITQAGKSLGVVISQRDRGFINLVKTMQKTEGMTFQQARAVAVLNEFYRQSKKAIGDYARTKDNLANVERRLNEQLKQAKIEIGKSLLPMYLAFDKVLLSILTPSKTLTEQFAAQSDKIKSLQSRLTPLMAEYDKLETKSNKNKIEQAKLKTIIGQIADIMPSAVTQWDNYGNAIDISTGKIEENLKKQKILAEYLNKSAIKDELGNMKSYALDLEIATDKLNKLSKTHRLMVTEQRGEHFVPVSVEFKGKDLETKLRELRGEAKSLSKDLLGSAANLEKMGGTIPKEFIDRVKALRGEVNKISEGAGKKSIAPIDLDLLEKEAALYEELYYGSTKWYKKAVELVKAQTKAMVAAGIKKVDALKWEKSAVEKLTEKYNELKKAQDTSGVKPKGGGISTPGSLSPVATSPNVQPGSDTGLQGTFDFYKKQADDAAGWAEGVQSAAEIAHGAMSGFFSDIYLQGEKYNSLLEKAWQGMANAFIAQVERMITKWAAFQAIKGLFSLIPGGGAVFSALTNPSGKANGGTFYGGKQMASGGSFTVPGGFPNDSYPMLVQSGERVDVTPRNRVNQLEKTMNGIHKQISVLNANMIDIMVGQQNGVLDVNVRGKLDGQDIYVAGEQGGRVYNRYR